MNWQAVLREVCHAFNTMPSMKGKWFFCFGTMLTLVRDHGKFKHDDDVDIGVYYDNFEWRYIKNFCSARGYTVERKILDDVDKKPLYMSLAPSEDTKKVTGEWFLDIFAWRKYKDFYWHTYDTQFEFPKHGIPKQYKFKGVPAETLEAGVVPRENLADSMMHGWIPLRYGTLLDLWYPDWLHKRQECSHDKYILETKSCKSFLNGQFETENL